MILSGESYAVNVVIKINVLSLPISVKFFIYTLFYSATNRSDYIAPNGDTISG
jgi:hypothetical protein